MKQRDFDFLEGWPILSSELKNSEKDIVRKNLFGCVSLVFVFGLALLSSSQMLGKTDIWAFLKEDGAVLLYAFLAIIVCNLLLTPLLVYYSVRDQRRVFVFDDRIEFHYLINKKRNGMLRIKDFDDYFVDVHHEGLHYTCYRVFIRKGRQLYLYITSDMYSNYDDLLEVLKTNFHLQKVRETLDYSKKEFRTAVNGGYILLD